MRKQHIFIDDYSKLSTHERDLLTRWYQKECHKKFTEPSELTIGEMIQLIGRRLNSIVTWDNEQYKIALYEMWGIKPVKNIELCDGLWKVIKQMLNRFEYMQIDI